MFDYLQKFNSLSDGLKASVSSKEVMDIISDLEDVYKVDLAVLVMKVMVKDVSLADLPMHLVSDFFLDEDKAKKLSSELKEKVFISAANYLGYIPSYSQIRPQTSVATNSLVDQVLKETVINLPSLETKNRFRNILNTYLKGIRNKIDTRITLNKSIISGGLGLSHQDIDSIFKICDQVKSSHTLAKEKTISLPKNGLEKVRQMYERGSITRDIPYNLHQAIAEGKVKKKEAPLNLPVPEEFKGKRINSHQQKYLEESELAHEKKLDIALKDKQISTVQNNKNLPEPEEATEKLLTSPKEEIKPKMREQTQTQKKAPLQAQVSTPPISSVKTNKEDKEILETKKDLSLESVISLPDQEQEEIKKSLEQFSALNDNKNNHTPIKNNNQEKKVAISLDKFKEKINEIQKNKSEVKKEDKEYKEKQVETSKSLINGLKVDAKQSANSPISSTIVNTSLTHNNNSTVKSNEVNNDSSLENKLDYKPHNIVKFDKPAPNKNIFWGVNKSKEDHKAVSNVEKKLVKEEVKPLEDKKNSDNNDSKSKTVANLRLNSKPSLSDIKVKPRVMSPVDELRYLDLTNFRRLGSSPADASKKVLSKIKLLERDGYDKMMQGINAWRHSPLNALYLKMGKDALLNNMDLKSFSVNAQNSGKNNFLLWEEIEEIISLNSKFMF